MDEQVKELRAARRQEASALFQAGQAARLAGERVTALIFGIVGIAVAAGINAHNDRVAIPLPPLILLLMSYGFQQYTDVTVLGVGRERLEQLTNDPLHPALIYETIIAPIHKGKGVLGYSMLSLQILVGLVVLMVVVVGTIVAFRDERWYVEIGFAAATGAALASTGSSFWAMLHARRAATTALDAQLPLRAEAKPD